MGRKRVIALILLVAGVLIGYFDYYSEVTPNSALSKPFKLGLDLKGGSELIYLADTSGLKTSDIGDAMSSLRDVIERRINVFGVTEPVIRVEQSGVGAGVQHRLTIELPGETNLENAVAMIDRTPTLEFKAERPEGSEKDAIVAARKQLQEMQKAVGSTTPLNLASINPKLLETASQDPDFIPTGLTGKYLSRATVEWSQQSIGPSISVEFKPDGATLFGEITKANVNKRIGIFLDGELISAPTVREEIANGKAQITGQFTIDEAKTLVRDLNLGALPVPIKLASTQTIGATLGSDALNKGLKAGLLAFAVIALFMVLWYRLPGLVAAISLSIYVAIILAIFKLIPVTLTAAGIAGFILSLGIAVDANVLIFERMREELKRGKNISGATEDGFARAWTSIRDSNLSTIISGLVLFWFGTSLIKGFALNLVLGVIVSMFTAIILTRNFLYALGSGREEGLGRKFLFNSSLKN